MYFSRLQIYAVAHMSPKASDTVGHRHKFAVLVGTFAFYAE
jgi:hypothetical protein